VPRRPVGPPAGHEYPHPVATIRLFAAARDAAGTGRDSIPGTTVAEVLDAACRRYGPRFGDVLATAQVWRNGDPAELGDAVGDADEVAVLPPVSGGSEATAPAAPRTPSPARGRPGAPAPVERRGSRSGPVGLTRSLGEGLVGGYDVAGPRVRLGLLWVVALLGSIALGTWELAVVVALVAGAAGAQTAAAWRRVGGRACRPVAGLSGLVLPLAAALGTASLGVAAVVAAVAAVVAAQLDRRRVRSIWADGGLTVRCGYPVGLAAASLVVIRHLEIGAAVSLVLLVCAYDVGDFLVGTGANTPFEGPVSGILAAMVVAFALGVFTVPPFAMASALVFGGLAAALFPLGQLAATEMLPAADARAPALRRLDSLLLAGPLWLGALWRYLH
jgi:molybdopterin converting factor small subunit